MKQETREIMRITKKEAKERGLTESFICPFHDKHPDQTAITRTCNDCIWIEDYCGCTPDMECEICNESLRDRKDHE